MQCVQKESGLLEYLTAKEEKDVMICGIMTDFCINATVEAGFEHGLHMIVPAYANSTQDNEYMTREQAYHYYMNFSGLNDMQTAYQWTGHWNYSKNDIA